MIIFEFFKLKMKLFTWESLPMETLDVKVQYYSSIESEWLTLYEDTIVDGFLAIEKEVRGSSTEETTFYDMVKYLRLPLMRIIPKDPPAGLAKQAVIAESFYFEQIREDDLEKFIVDFGKLYLIPEELIVDSSTEFKNHLPVANAYPLSTEEPEAPPVPIQDLYTNLVSEIASANDSNADSPYKLSNISVKLKALIHGEGESLSASLLNLENSENVNGDAISELVFDITPVNNRAEGGIAIPNLIGLTETAVRRILRSIGLQLNPVYQKKEGVVNGDSFKQYPAQGVSIQPKQLVTVIFSKYE